MIKAYASFPEPSRSWNFVSTLKIIAMKNIYLLFFALTIGTVHQAQGDFTWAIFDNYTAQHDNYCFDLALFLAFDKKITPPVLEKDRIFGRSSWRGFKNKLVVLFEYLMFAILR